MIKFVKKMSGIIFHYFVISNLIGLETSQGQGHCVQGGGIRTPKGDSDTGQGGFGHQCKYGAKMVNAKNRPILII